MEPVFSRLKKSWEVAAQTAVWLYGIIATFTSSLPYDFDYATVTAGSDQALQSQNTALGKFLVTVILGIFIIPATRWNKRKHQWYWAGMGLALLVLLLVCYFWQQNARESCVSVYSGRNLLIGRTYTPEAAGEVRASHVTNRELIDEFNVSRMDKIWTVDSMNSCRQELLVSHLLTLLAGVLAVLCTMQAVRCTKGRK